MVSRYHVAILSGVLSGCSAPALPPKPGGSDTASAPAVKDRRVTTLADIQGQWDIVRFGNMEPARLHYDGSRAAYFDIRGQWLGYSIGCNMSGNPAQIDASGILRDKGDGSRIQTLKGCGADLNDFEGRFFRFSGTNPRVFLTSDGQLRFVNDSIELLLERPEVRRLANVPSWAEIIGRWVAQSANREEPRGGMSGVGFGGNDDVLTITPDRLSYSRCPSADVRVRYTDDARLVAVGEPGAPNCRFTAEIEPTYRRASEALVRVMRASPAVERTPGGGLVLMAGADTIFLLREEDVLNPPPLPPVPPGLRVAPPPPPPPPPPPR